MNIFSLFNKTIAFLLASIPLVYAQNPNIRFNQVGFYPNAAKIAVWVGNKFESFYLFDAISKRNAEAALEIITTILNNNH